jgi:hypothetical protein
MPRFLTQSSRRLLAVAALVTATAVPSVVIAGQTAAGANVNMTGTTASTRTPPSTMGTDSTKWR